MLDPFLPTFTPPPSSSPHRPARLLQLEPALMAVTGVTPLERAGILSSRAAAAEAGAGGGGGAAGELESKATAALSAIWSTASSLLSPSQPQPPQASHPQASHPQA